MTSPTSPTSPASPAAIARFTGPAEFAALVPMLTGFVPRESVVVVSLRPPRKRIGLTMRFDLPLPEHEEELAAEVSARLAHDGAMSALVVVYTDAPDDGRRRAGERLVDRITDACGFAFEDAMLVRHGRWWSYRCRTSTCCPADGTPLEAPATPALELMAAESALEGRAVLPSRDDLVRTVAPPQLLAEQSALEHLDAAAEEWAKTALRDVDRARAEATALARRLLDEVADGGTADPPEVAALALAVHDVQVRDELATWMLDRGSDLLALLLQLVPQVAPPYDAPICTLLAWVAYGEGNGGLANVALDRALATDGTYSMAVLLRTALDGQVPPGDVKKILRGTAKVLSARKRRRR